MSDVAGPPVLRAVHGAVLVLALNRPHVRNAFDRRAAECMEREIDAFEADPALRVAVVTGSASFFCAGADLKAAAREGGLPRSNVRGWFGVLEKLPGKPLVAAVEGMAIGGGLELALACDLVVASRTSLFGLPEVQRGVMAYAGGLFRLPQRLPRNIAMEMVLTGDPMPAAQMHASGLVNRLCEPGQARETALVLAQRIAQQAPLSVRTSVAVVRDAAGCSDTKGWAMQAPALDALRQSADYRESVIAFAERRTPHWRGS